MVKASGLARLFCQLPDTFPADKAALLEIRVVQGERVLVRETLDVAGGNAEPAFIEILAGHSAEVQRLQALAAKKPDSVKVIVTAGQVTLVTKSLERFEAAPKAMTRPPIGSPRLMTVNLAAPRLKVAAQGWEPDPQCVQYCEDERYFCYTERCDPRGSCEYCETYYQDCVGSCPQVCVDPKNVYNYDTYAYQFSYYYGQECRDDWNWWDNIGDLYNHWIDVYTKTTYQRTEYCDGSYTDQFVGQSTVYDECWTEVWPHQYCSYPWWGPPNTCAYPHF